jgi:hypothetical protein
MLGTSAATVAARRQRRDSNSASAFSARGDPQIRCYRFAAHSCYAGLLRESATPRLLRSRTGPDVGVRAFADMRPTPIACYGRPRILKARDRPAALIDPLQAFATVGFRAMESRTFPLTSIGADAP